MSNHNVTQKELAKLMYQYAISHDFLFHYLSYKELSIHSEKLNEKFWSYTRNAHIMQAFNHWCMVFGSTKNNDTHWGKLSFNREFKTKLLKELKMSEDEWEKNWSNIKQFRNKYVSHREMRYNKPVPQLEIAYKTILIYDDWISYKALGSPNPIEGLQPLKVTIKEQKEAIQQAVQRLLNN